MFNQGISKMGDLLELGVSEGILKKAGAFYSYGETRLGQGRENSKDFLAQHPEIAESIETRVRGKVSPDSEQPANPAPPAEADVNAILATLTDEEDPE